MNVRPLNDRIIVRPCEVPSTSNGGIVMVSTSNEAVIRAQVVAIGSERTLKNGQTVPFSVKYGDVVYFEQNSATKARVEGEELFVLREEDVLAVEDDQEAHS